MEKEQTFKQRVFDILHEGQTAFRYRILTSVKRRLSDKIEAVYMEFMVEYIAQAIEVAEQSWLEARAIELEVPEPDIVVDIKIQEEEKISFMEKWFGKKR